MAKRCNGAITNELSVLKADDCGSLRLCDGISQNGRTLKQRGVGVLLRRQDLAGQANNTDVTQFVSRTFAQRQGIIEEKALKLELHAKEVVHWAEEPTNHAAGIANSTGKLGPLDGGIVALRSSSANERTFELVDVVQGTLLGSCTCHVCYATPTISPTRLDSVSKLFDCPKEVGAREFLRREDLDQFLGRRDEILVRAVTDELSDVLFRHYLLRDQLSCTFSQTKTKLSLKTANRRFGPATWTIFTAERSFIHDRHERVGQ